MSRESPTPQPNTEPTALRLLPPAEPFLRCNGLNQHAFSSMDGCTEVWTSILRDNLLGGEDTANSARDMGQGTFFPNNSHDARWAAAGRKQLF